MATRILKLLPVLILLLCGCDDGIYVRVLISGMTDEVKTIRAWVSLNGVMATGSPSSPRDFDKDLYSIALRLPKWAMGNLKVSLTGLDVHQCPIAAGGGDVTVADSEQKDVTFALVQLVGENKPGSCGTCRGLEKGSCSMHTQTCEWVSCAENEKSASCWPKGEFTTPGGRCPCYAVNDLGQTSDVVEKRNKCNSMSPLCEWNLGQIFVPVSKMYDPAPNFQSQLEACFPSGMWSKAKDAGERCYETPVGSCIPETEKNKPWMCALCSGVCLLKSIWSDRCPMDCAALENPVKCDSQKWACVWDEKCMPRQKPKLTSNWR